MITENAGMSIAVDNTRRFKKCPRKIGSTVKESEVCYTEKVGDVVECDDVTGNERIKLSHLRNHTDGDTPATPLKISVLYPAHRENNPARKYPPR